MNSVVYLSDKQISERYNISRGTVWNWLRDGKLPKPVKLSSACTRWRLSDLEQWEEQRESA